jgi:hypothetical protein
VPRHQSFAFAAQFLPGHAAGPSGISANSKKCVARQSTIAHPRSAKLARRRTRTPLHKMLCALRAPELIWRLARRGRRRDVRVGRCSAEGAAGLASARRAIRLICVGWIPQGPVFRRGVPPTVARSARRLGVHHTRHRRCGLHIQTSPGANLDHGRFPLFGCGRRASASRTATTSPIASGDRPSLRAGPDIKLHTV